MPHPALSTPKQSDFLAIPESPLVYWLRPKFFELLQGKTLRDVASVSQGMATADDGRFVRFVWEAPSSLMGKRWVTYEKGGGYGKWFGHQYWMVDWRYNGANIKATSGPRVQNEHFYFHTGWTYSYMASGSLGLRRLEGKGISSDLASGIYQSEAGTAAVLNCRFASSVIRAVSAKLQLRESYVARVPFPSQIPRLLPILESYCLTLKRHLVAADPTERSFAGVPTAIAPGEAVAALLHTLV